MLNLCYGVESMRAGRKVKTSEKERSRAAKSIADESMVLLKNEGVLPLRKGMRVAVSGCYARPESGMIAGGGSSQVTWRGKGFDLASLLERRLKSAVTYETMFLFDGVVGHGEFGSNPDEGLLKAALADVQVVCVGTGAPFEYESVDRKTVRLRLPRFRRGRSSTWRRSIPISSWRYSQGRQSTCLHGSTAFRRSCLRVFAEKLAGNRLPISLRAPSIRAEN